MQKIGKVINTHGIKGEVRTFLTSFDMFQQLNNVKEVIIGKEKFIIESFRKHKNFVLLTFKGVKNINEVLHLKNQDITINKVKEEVFLQATLTGYSVINSNDVLIGKIKDIIFNNAHGVADMGDKMFPLVEKFIISINEKEKIIKTNYFDEVNNEN